MVGQFGNVQQPFQTVLEADEHAEIRDLRDRSRDDLTGLVLAGNVSLPGVFAQLLQSQGDPATLLIDREHAALDLLVLLDDFVGMADLSGPRHVADMQQPVDPFLDLDKRAVIGQVPYGPLDHTVDRVAFGGIVPRVGLGLFDPQGDLLLLLVDSQDDHFDFVVDLHQFARVADPPGPRHLADVDQSFDPFLELHERTVAHHIDDAAGDPRSDGILLLDLLPRTGRFLLQSQGDLFLLVIDMQDLDFDLLIDRDHLRRMRDPSPTHVRDMQQTVDPA